MAIPKLERLMNLIAALLHTSVPLSAETLRTRVEGYDSTAAAFRRQFERDKEDLREMGVPIRIGTVPGVDPPVDGYWIDRQEYYLPDPGLTPDELAALHLATRMVPLATSGTAGIWKLGGAPPADARIAADAPDGPIATIPVDANLTELFTAAAQRRAVAFDYRGSERRLEPWLLGFQGGHWYVSGHDVDQSERRLFRLDRITGPVRLQGPAEHPRADRSAELTSFDPWSVGDLVSMTARVQVDAVAAATVIEEVGRARVVHQEDDGSVEVDLDVTNPEGFRSWLLGYGDRVEVVSPPELRTMVVDWLRDLVSREEA